MRKLTSLLSTERKKIKVSTERHERKQQAQRGTGVNIDCGWAPPGIAKLWVSLPKQGAAITTISWRITKIISERRLPENNDQEHSKNGFTIPFEIYGSQEVIKTLSDPGAGCTKVLAVTIANGNRIHHDGFSKINLFLPIY